MLRVPPSEPAPVLEYREQPPGCRLLPFVNCYWSLRAPQPLRLRDRTFPDGCQEIVFNIGTQVLRSDNGRDYFRNPAVELIGQMTRAYDIVTEGEQLYFGVKFHPHGFAAFTPEPVDSLRDQSIDLHLLFGRGFDEVHERIVERRSWAHFVQAMERCLLARLDAGQSASRAFRDVDAMVRAIFAAPGEGGLRQAYGRADLGRRRLQGAFRRMTGLSPQQLTGMVRFQSCFDGLQAGVPYPQLALACGYYDQAHFNREFRRYTGMTPGAWKQAQAPLNRYFVDASSLAYLCNHPVGAARGGDAAAG